MKRLREAPAIASVITAEQIRNMGARNLMDILKIVPGIGTYMEFVGMQTIDVRGMKTANAEKVLIMINGFGVHDNIFGSAMQYNDNLFVDNIKRIEIIRGPGSAMYGSNAFVAVINIITMNSDDIDGVRLNAGGGRFGTQKYNLLFGKKLKKLKVSGSFDYYKTDGPGLLVEEDFQTSLDGALGTSASIAPGKTDDWIDKYDLNLDLSFKDFNFKGKYIKKEMGPYIGPAYALNDESVIKNSQWHGVLGYEKSLTENLNLAVKGYAKQSEQDKYWEAFPEGVNLGKGVFTDGNIGHPIIKNRTLGTELAVDYLLFNNHKITAGGLFENIDQFHVSVSANSDSVTNAPLTGGLQDITATQNFNREVDRDVWALFAQDEWNIMKSLNLTLGVRHDHYSDFGGTTNFRTGLIWSFSDNGEIKLLFGEAFRAPNFVELYNINNNSVLGNPDLTPETIKTYEAGVEYRFGNFLKTNLNYFHYQIKDLIQLTTTTAGREYNNIGKVKSDGVEVEFKSIWSENSYGYANYSYQYSRDDTGAVLEDVPRHRGNIGLNLGMGKYINANANLFLTGSKKRPSGDTRSSLPGYALVDLTLIGKNFYKTTEIRASIHNLFDKKYVDPAPQSKIPNDFPRPGIEFMIDLSYSF
ncbi:MAG TPA: TonB-dependent receptor [Nitrospinota bacterium]|nr:TonB-dependent receptor [Nitrospinota bacterium]